MTAKHIHYIYYSISIELREAVSLADRFKARIPQRLAAKAAGTGGTYAKWRLKLSEMILKK
jgi:hypothetical protein